VNRNAWRLVFLAGIATLGFTGASNRLVVCHTTVRDRSGRLVSNLQEKAFTVSENGIKQDIRLFSHEDVPVSLGLIVDNSGGMRAKRSSVESAAQALVKDGNPADEVFVVNFNEKVYFDNPVGRDFMTGREEIQEALRRIDSRGGAAVREAVGASIDWMKKAHRQTHVLVLLTGGVDDASHVKLEDLVRSAQQTEVLIYVIGLLDGEEKRMARDARRQLDALAESTGGESFYLLELTEVDRIAQQVARDIRSLYTIGYQPSDQALDGNIRRIKITVKASGKPTALTRSGYYAAAN